jgi:hypothetical protein
LVRERAPPDRVLPEPDFARLEAEREDFARADVERDELPPERDDFERLALAREVVLREALDRDVVLREPLDREVVLRVPLDPPFDELRDLVDELRERREAERPLRRSAAGISSRATAFASCGICFSRNLAIRSSSRLMPRASFAVSLSPTLSARASIPA